MNDTHFSYDPNTIGQAKSTTNVAADRIFNYAYGWMTVGLAISGTVAWFAAQSDLLLRSRAISPICIVVLFALVIGINAGKNKLSVMAATMLFLLFSAVMGITLSAIFYVYTPGTLQSVFFITAAMFAGLAIYGTVTKRDLSGVGSICMMGLWGIIVASIVNYFFKSNNMSIIINYVGVAVFTGLTLWDAQKVKLLAQQAHTMDKQTVARMGILAALSLYLDFINLFLMLLRLFGGNGRRS